MKALIRKIVKKIKKEKCLIVLLYHKISENVSPFDSLTVTPQNYKAHLTFIKQNFKIYANIAEWEQGKESGILITFDDGYFNNLSQALPIHIEQNIPFTLYTTTYWLNKKDMFWWESIVKYHQNQKEINIDTCKSELKNVMHLKSIEEKENAVKYIVDDKVFSKKEREELRPMSKNELIELSSNELVTIGSHTITHPRLALLDFETQELEIKNSKIELENLLGKSVDIFSYPHGGKTAFNKDSKTISKQAGYNYAFAAYNGVYKSGGDKFEIPRIHIGNVSVKELKTKLAKFI